MRNNPLEHCWDDYCGPINGFVAGCNCNCPECRSADEKDPGPDDREINEAMTATALAGEGPYLVDFGLRQWKFSVIREMDAFVAWRAHPDKSSHYYANRLYRTRRQLEEHVQAVLSGHEELPHQNQWLRDAQYILSPSPAPDVQNQSRPIEFQTRATFADESHLAQVLVASLSRDRLLRLIKAIELEVADVDFLEEIYEWARACKEDQ